MAQGFYTVYETSTGQITGNLFCDESILHLNIPSGHAAIKGEYSHLEYEIDLDNLQPRPKPEELPSLEDLKSSASERINTACRKAITGGYTSDALGTTHTYPSKRIDQSNMIASVTDSYNPLNDQNWTTLFWCEDSSGVWEMRAHTAAQIQKVGADGKKWITDCQLKNAQLQSQIQSATSETELEQIQW